MRHGGPPPPTLATPQPLVQPRTPPVQITNRSQLFTLAVPAARQRPPPRSLCPLHRPPAPLDLRARAQTLARAPCVFGVSARSAGAAIRWIAAPNQRHRAPITQQGAVGLPLQIDRCSGAGFRCDRPAALFASHASSYRGGLTRSRYGARRAELCTPAGQHPLPVSPAALCSEDRPHPLIPLLTLDPPRKSMSSLFRSGTSIPSWTKQH